MNYVVYLCAYTPEHALINAWGPLANAYSYKFLVYVAVAAT